MRILITGGFGYIGGYLGMYLNTFGHEITLATRNTINSTEWISYAKGKTINWDSKSSILKCCEDIDVVIHSAGMNAKDCELDPVEALNFNGKATERLANAVLQTNVKKTIYISTAHVYASPLVGDIDEESPLLNKNAYAISHAMGELAVLNLNKSEKCQGIVLRISNGFGAPRHRGVKCWDLVVNDLCKQVVTKQKLYLKSDGNQYRDFIGLEQIGYAVKEFVNKEYLCRNKIYNIGSGKTKTVLEMAKLIQERAQIILGYKPQLEINPSKQNLNYEKFNYKVNKINSLGIIFHYNNFLNEIDSLLMYCKESFIKKN